MTKDVTYDDIIARLKPLNDVAEKLGVKPHVVRDFGIRGRIAAEYFDRLVKLGYCTAGEILSAAASGTCQRDPKGSRQESHSASLS